VNFINAPNQSRDYFEDKILLHNSHKKYTKSAKFVKRKNRNAREDSHESSTVGNEAK
jgi:hypothetical protein